MKGEYTERDDLQGEEGLKSLAPPLTAQTAGAIEPIFGLGILQRHRTGVTVAIFEFPSGTPKNRPPRANWGWGPQILGGQFFGGSRWKFENRYGDASSMPLMYSQPKYGLNSPSGLGCRWGC